MSDLWTYLKSAEKPIVMYGMGNGADKIISVLEACGIEVDDFFASEETYRANMDNTLNGGQKTLVSTQIVMIDVDGKHDPPTLSQFLEQTQLIPTFYYETFSSQNGERYRLGYMINKEIKSKAEYNAIAHIIVTQGIDYVPDGTIEDE